MEKMIRIPRKDPSVNKSGVIKVTPAAVDALLDVARHTNMSIRDIASTIITQAVNGNMISYDGDGTDD